MEEDVIEKMRTNHMNDNINITYYIDLNHVNLRKSNVNLKYMSMY